jgi:membrane-bound serine protease (ClpP class)
MRRRIFPLFILALMTVLALLPVATGAAAGPKKVYVLHIDRMQEIGPSIAQITKRVFQQAEADPDAVAVAMLIDTPGGLVSSALEMKNTILGSKLMSVAFVNDNAISAGALIATAAEKLYMNPGSLIGAAEPRDAVTNSKVDPKTLSVVVSAFASTAQARGRDESLARAMVDQSAKVTGQTTALLTMTYKDAVQRKYADGEAKSLDEALQQAGITNYTLVNFEPTFGEQVGRFLILPWVATALLVIGIIALGIEFIKPGVTLPGMIGVICLSLFFLGNVLVGTAGWLELALALIGVLLLLIEAFIPGFGVFGFGGAAAIGASIFLAVPSQDLALLYLMAAAVAFCIVLVAIVRTISKRGLGKALTLESDAKGFVPARADLAYLVGTKGTALTVLRPAGTAQFGDLKVDVVTEGDYVVAGTALAVIRVDGTRVVVRSLPE